MDPLGRLVSTGLHLLGLGGTMLLGEASGPRELGSRHDGVANLLASRLWPTLGNLHRR